MIIYRLVRIFIQVMVGMWTCAVVFPWVSVDARQRRIKLWSAQLLSICSVQVDAIDIDASPLAERALNIANHVSWLDIFVINSVQPCRFVAKSDIRDWPLFGWLSSKGGTIFISRGKLREVRKIYGDLVASLDAGEHVAFFPEGTTGAQGGLLPFHANLFEAAIEARVPIQPYALRYVDAAGRLIPAVNFIDDMTFAESIIMILKPPKITAQLIRLPLIDTTDGHRRTLALAAHAAIAATLQERLVG